MSTDSSTLTKAPSLLPQNPFSISGLFLPHSRPNLNHPKLLIYLTKNPKGAYLTGSPLFIFYFFIPILIGFNVLYLFDFSMLYRLLYRSKQRGFLELDLVLGKWVEDNIHKLDQIRIKALIHVLDLVIYLHLHITLIIILRPFHFFYVISLFVCLVGFHPQHELMM